MSYSSFKPLMLPISLSLALWGLPLLSEAQTLRDRVEARIQERQALRSGASTASQTPATTPAGVGGQNPSAAPGVEPGIGSGPASGISGASVGQGRLREAIVARQAARATEGTVAGPINTARPAQDGPLARPGSPGERTGIASQLTQMKESNHPWTGPYPSGTRVLKDQAYGFSSSQKMDVYLPAKASSEPVPVIVMVHGGGWSRGDKAAAAVVENKVKRWNPKGIAIISINYPMIPEADPGQQALEVGKALAWIEGHAFELRIDTRKLVLMGHSAGAHLIDLLAVKPSLAKSVGFKGSWQGVVSLDSGSMDVESTMKERHLPLFDNAFGPNPSFWRQVSPMANLTHNPGPMLLVCSLERKESCGQNKAFMTKANVLGASMRILPENLSHGEINAQLGQESFYTNQVELFLQEVGLL